jgi:hypothetical protein
VSEPITTLLTIAASVASAFENVPYIRDRDIGQVTFTVTEEGTPFLETPKIATKNTGTCRPQGPIINQERAREVG